MDKSQDKSPKTTARSVAKQIHTSWWETTPFDHLMAKLRWNTLTHVNMKQLRPDVMCMKEKGMDKHKQTKTQNS